MATNTKNGGRDADGCGPVTGPLTPAARLARARWRSRRGLLELELLLAPFARDHLPAVSPRLMDAYDNLLGCEDLDVHAWLLAREPAPREFQAIVAEIRRYLSLG